MNQRIGFGGSCHWCTEAIFQSLRGVTRVEQGWIASEPPDDAFSEAVLVTFDRTVIPLDVLVRVHLASHSSTADHSMRDKYRSAVYVFDEQQADVAYRTIAAVELELGGDVVTRVLPFESFRSNEDRYLNYYASDPERPFCRVVIEPKLAALTKQFSDRVDLSRLS